MIQQHPGSADDTSKFNVKIDSYDFALNYSQKDPGSQLPSFYKEQQGGRNSRLFWKSHEQELGYLKLRFFDSVTIFKPATTIFCFDWQMLAIGAFDWLECEKFIVDQIFDFRENCSITAKQTRIMLCIFLPLNEEVNADECRNSLKKSINQRSPEDPWHANIKQIYVFTNGYAQMEHNKDFTKKVFENTTNYYLYKKRENKAKQKKLINKEQNEFVRFAYKSGIYSQLSKGDLTHSIKHVRDAYENIKQGVINN